MCPDICLENNPTAEARAEEGGPTEDKPEQEEDTNGEVAPAVESGTNRHHEPPQILQINDYFSATAQWNFLFV